MSATKQEVIDRVYDDIIGVLDEIHKKSEPLRPETVKTLAEAFATVAQYDNRSPSESGGVTFV